MSKIRVKETMKNTSPIIEEFLKELKEKYNIELKYGDINYTYTKVESVYTEEMLLKTKKSKVKDFIRLITKLPNVASLKNIELKYSALMSKFVIHAKHNGELITLEYIHIDSARELLKLAYI